MLKLFVYSTQLELTAVLQIPKKSYHPFLGYDRCILIIFQNKITYNKSNYLASNFIKIQFCNHTFWIQVWPSKTHSFGGKSACRISASDPAASAPPGWLPLSLTQTRGKQNYEARCCLKCENFTNMGMSYSTRESAFSFHLSLIFWYSISALIEEVLFHKFVHRFLVSMAPHSHVRSGQYDSPSTAI